SYNHLSVLEVTLNLIGNGRDLLAIDLHSPEMVPRSVELIRQFARSSFQRLGLIVGKQDKGSSRANVRAPLASEFPSCAQVRRRCELPKRKSFDLCLRFASKRKLTAIERAMDRIYYKPDTGLVKM